MVQEMLRGSLARRLPPLERATRLASPYEKVNEMSEKRSDVISWDEFFMRVAIAAQLRSKDPNTQVGACIADVNHRILSVGYNGTPHAMTDDEFPWGASVDPLKDKHSYVVHAEANAILNYRGSLVDLRGSVAYVTLFPCHECAKLLAQAGIGEVVYLDDKYYGTTDSRISRQVFDSCGIGYRQIELSPLPL
jgi:dCMP deaminase